LPQRLALLIGPEGGFEEQEIELARHSGLRVVSLGPRILRAETAALAAATVVLSELGELG
jgi:16S rRNA (uracil1498-N3)-methyltransferase